MSQCVRCEAKAQTFLCRYCTTKLAETLRGLPRWIGYLTETALGLTTLGGDGNALRGWREPQHLDGDVYVSTGDPKLLDRFLRAGRIDARAARELDSLTSMLSSWCRDLCEMRGLDVPALRTPTQMARWLKADVIALHPAADEFCDELEVHVARIERIINRPVPPRFCGRCTTVDDDRKRCEAALYARREAIQVTCPKCRMTHDIEELFTRQLNESAYLRFTRSELIGNQRTADADRYWCGLMGQLGEPIHYKMFERWVGMRILVPAGYRRVDGRIGCSRHSDADEPVYRLSDVRRLRTTMPQRKLRMAT